MKVALLGLGAMGAAIARRLEATDDVELTVYNRSPAPLGEFRERGVSTAPTPREAAVSADVAISMLADGGAVEAVALDEDGALGASPGALIDMSTIDIATSLRVAERAAAAGVAYLRAPVSGNPSVVAAGNLTILVSGDARAYERTRGVLEAIGPTLFYLGDAEQARVMKLALNLMVAGTTELLAEALVLGEASGLQRAQMLDVIGGSAVGSPFVKYKSGPLAAEDFTSTFSARLMHKDLRLVAGSASPSRRSSSSWCRPASARAWASSISRSSCRAWSGTPAVGRRFRVPSRAGRCATRAGRRPTGRPAS
jgi:3-hydroxyisobutyrate dehydrogenase-like beta-hydroxyacid dehydrogenase